MSRIPFQTGDPAPWFTCPATGNNEYHFDSVAGRYIVLSFLGSSTIPTSVAALEYFSSELRHYFDDKHMAFFALSVDSNDIQKLQMLLPGMRYFFDIDQNVSRLYRAISSKNLEG